MFNVSALLLDDTSETATPLTNGEINQTLRQFAPLSDDRLFQLVDCRESSTVISHSLKNIPNSIIELKFGVAKNVQNLARVRTASKFESEYFWNG